jgi:glycosyltransferase involved in cell wall biosynthesis
MKRIVFYSPIKIPDESAPSGLARVAALIIRAFEKAGFLVERPALPLSYEPLGDETAQKRLRDAAINAAAAFVAECKKGATPLAFVTYHNYYKSPDWIGPMVKRALGCRYMVIEGSYAPKRQTGPWALNHKGSADGLRDADILFATTALDRQCLSHVTGPLTRLIDLPPFIDVKAYSPVRPMSLQSMPHVLAAAMMRDARKRESFRRVANAIANLNPNRYRLSIAGDGIERPLIEAYFSALKNSGHDIRFLGAVPGADMPAVLRQADILAWPGVGEAYGLIYLEAQASGAPVVAEAHKGVPDVVKDGISGRLTDSQTPAAFGQALKDMIENPLARARLAKSARAWVASERSIESTAARLSEAMSGFI